MVEDPESCVSKLKTLADATRLTVVRELLAGGPKHVWELNEALDLEPSLLSKHLRVLREADLVTSARDGKAVLYQLAPGVAGALENGELDLGCCRLSFPRKDLV